MQEKLFDMFYCLFPFSLGSMISPGRVARPEDSIFSLDDRIFSFC